MLTKNDLIADLASGVKPKSDWRIGLEHEQFAFHTHTQKPVLYDGANGIGALLTYFAEAHDWTPEYDAGKVIAVKGPDGSAITLEPGGQVEYSGAPFGSSDKIMAEYDRFSADLTEIADALDIDFLAQGMHPEWSRADMPLMPKSRYKIMKAYMPTRGSLGLDMMFRTCGTQLNLDFSSEKDMVKKFRVATALQSIMMAHLASSRIVEGQDSGYASYRAHIWTDTDPGRSGVPDFIFDDDMSFEKYVDYALSIPMYFVIRDNSYIDATGETFEDFMAGKLSSAPNEIATLKDWHVHLSTLFPEVRLKSYLELRALDSAPRDKISDMVSFFEGLLYNDARLDRAADLIKDWPKHSHEAHYAVVAKDGWNGVLHTGETVWDFTQRLFKELEWDFPLAHRKD